MAKKRPTSQKFDLVDKAAALAIMTSTAAEKKMPTGIPIQSLVGDVCGYVAVTFHELRARLQSWVNRGWGVMNNNIFVLTKLGRHHLRVVARAA